MMEIMQWKSEYEVGHPIIDAQHKKLLAIIRKLQETFVANEADAKDSIRTVLIELVDYAVHHFATEETIQKDIDFYERVEHSQLHRSFVAELESVLNKLKRGEELNTFELLFFLGDWWVNHVMIEDRKIGQEWESRRVTSS